MNGKQRDEAARYLWDVSKITFTVLVVGQIATKDGFRLMGIAGGIIATFVLGAIAYYLRRSRRKS